MTIENTGEAGDRPTGCGEDTIWGSLGSALVSALHLPVPPVGITFCDDEQPEVPRFDAPLSAPADDGRRGRVAAGCVFWVHGAEQSFSTEAEDHGNCSVGQLTHGLAALADVAGHDDVGALIGSGWVDQAAIGSVPRVQTRHRFVIYGPLGSTAVAPDVVLIRVNGRQMMVMHDAVPAMSIEGKPQCHIVALAHEHGQVAASVGCALSRARTGMRPEEMTCAIPGPQLADVVAAVQRTGEVDTLVATYAARDARRSA